MGCKGLCSRYCIPTPPNHLRYKGRNKRCTNCELFFEAERVYCPCCTAMLRTRTKTGKKELAPRVC